MDFKYMLLHHCTTNHGMVEDLKVVINGFRGNLFAKPLLQYLMTHIQSNDNSATNIIPHLLHCRVINKMQIIPFNYVFCA